MSKDSEAGGIRADTLEMLIGINDYQSAKQPRTKAETTNAREAELEYYREYLKTIAIMNYERDDMTPEEAEEALVSQLGEIFSFENSEFEQFKRFYYAGEVEISHVAPL